MYTLIYLSFCHTKELKITSFTSVPDGYGLMNEQVTFSCKFSPALENVIIEWYHDTTVVATTGHNENYTISSFQPENSGNYSCSVLVTVGDVVLGGAISIEKSMKLAGTLDIHNGHFKY